MAIKISGNTVIDDSRNITSSGTMSANAYIGDGSQLTNLPGGGNVLEATASGTLSDGSKVIVNTDGTVSVVTQTETTGAGSGTPAVFNSNGSSQDMSAAYDSTNERVVVSYRDAGNNNIGMVVVGTVSGTSISFGTPVTFNSGFTTYTSTIFDPDTQKIVICYRDDGNNDYGRARVGTVSGTTIILGTAVPFNSASTNFISAVYDSTNQKVVIAYRDSGNNNRGKAIVGTVSGTSINFGSEFTFEYGATSYISAVYDSTNNKVVISYTDGGDPSNIIGRAIVGTVSGTSITYGSDTPFHNGYTADISAIFDSTNGKVVISWRDQTNSHYGTSIVGEVNPGTNAITFGSPVVFNSNGRIEPISAVFDSSTGKVVLSYRDHNNGQYGTVSVGTVSGTSINFDTPVVYNAAASDRNTSVYDPVSQKVVIAYQDDGNSQKGTGVVFSLAGQSIPQVGSASIFEYASPGDISATFDSTNSKVVIAYKDTGNSYYGTAVVGTVSGTSITFGTPEVFEYANCAYFSPTFDSSTGKVVIAYEDSDNSNYGTAVVGEISGTSITFGTPVTFAASVQYVKSTYDSTNQRVVIVFRHSGSSAYGTAVVGEVSGNSINFGALQTFNSAVTAHVGVTYDSANSKVIVVYHHGGAGGRGEYAVGTVNAGTNAITFGSPVTFDSGNCSELSPVYDSTNGRVVIAYVDQGNNDRGKAIVGEVSGNSITFGNVVIFHQNTNNIGQLSAAYDSTSGKVVITYHDKDNSYYGTALPGTVSGNSITFGSSIVFESDTTYNTAATFDSTNGKVVVAYRDNGNSSYGTAVAFSPITMVTNLTSENFIGVSDASYTNGQTATIQLAGSVDDAQSGLTPGSKYYVQGDGTLSTSADSPSVFAGTAVANTKLIVKN